MFTVVEIAQEKRRRRRATPELLRVPLPERTFFYVLRGSRRSEPRTLLRMAARCAPDVLTALPIPPDAAVRRFTPRAFPLQRAAAALCAILPETRLPPQELSVGALDPDGALCGRTEMLLPLAADVRIVTRDPRRFGEDALHARRRFGASLTVGENAALLTDCGAVVCAAPEAAIRGVPVVLSCAPADGAFSLLPVQMPETYARLCPASVPHDLFAAALAEKCGVRAPALFACAGAAYGGEPLDVPRAAALWRARIGSCVKKFS